MIDFNLENPLKNIEESESIALQTEDETVTYKQLIQQFRDISKLLKEHNIDGRHRILLLQQDTDLLKSYIVFLACVWYGCSPAYFNTKIGRTDSLLTYRLETFNPSAILFIDNLVIECIKDTALQTKIFKTEAFCNFTHGPSLDSPYNCNSLHWSKTHNQQYGHNLQSIVEVAVKTVKSKKINQLTNMNLTIPYSTDVLIRTILTGGKLSVFTKIDENGNPLISEDFFKNSEVNYICGYKKTYLDIFSNLTENLNIDGCEYGGGPLDCDMFENIFKKLNPKKLMYHFSSFFFGYTFIKYLDYDSNTDCLNLWNLNKDIYLDDKDIDFSNDGELLIRLHSEKKRDFESLGDIFDIKDNIATYKGRNNQDYLPRTATGGKLYIYEIENAILSLEEVTSVKLFYTTDKEYIDRGYHSYGMIYSGKIGPVTLSKKMRSILRKNKVPASIFNFNQTVVESIDRSEIVKLILTKY